MSISYKFFRHNLKPWWCNPNQNFMQYAYSGVNYTKKFCKIGLTFVYERINMPNPYPFHLRFRKYQQLLYLTRVRSAAFSIENFIYLFTKQANLMRGFNCTDPSPSVSFPCPTYLKTVKTAFR